jgi:GNAT superfamily N-acetyltransferase
VRLSRISIANVLELREVPEGERDSRKAEVIDRVSRRRAAARHADLDQVRRQIEEMYDETAARGVVRDVVESGARLGHVWAVQEAEETALYEVRLDQPERAPELLPALVEVARSNGSRMLGVGSGPDRDGASALVASPGFVPRATNMVLDLGGEIADPGLELRPMTPQEFDAFMEVMVVDYAATLAEAGLSQERAMERSREQTGQLIPDGQDSAGMEFFTGWAGDVPIGRLWLNVDQPMAFVYDVEVLEEQRRKGYGAGLMNAAAIWSRDHGHPVLGLNVFAHNPGARALYDKLGYRVSADYHTLDVPDA